MWMATALDRFFIVSSGRVRAYLANDKCELTLSFLEAGDIFSTHTPNYLASVGVSSIVAMDTRAFAQRMTRHPELTPFLMCTLGKLLSCAIGRIERLSLQDVGARVAGFLAQATRLCGTPAGDRWQVPLGLAASDIALLLGTTRQTVSAHLSAMARQGILERDGRHGSACASVLIPLTARTARAVRGRVLLSLHRGALCCRFVGFTPALPAE